MNGVEGESKSVSVDVNANRRPLNERVCMYRSVQHAC